MKKETLEEAAENYANKWYESTGELSVFTAVVSKNSFIAGAKWQAERISLMEIELNHTKTLLESCEKALEDRDKKADTMYSDMQEYAEFCIECDRKQIPLLLAQDWYEHYKK